MPTYQYACTNPEGKHEFEVVQSFSDPAVSTCPECGALVRKVYGSVGVVFKGSGFYRNDSRKSEAATAPTGSATAKESSGNGSKEPSPSSTKKEPSSSSAKKESTTSTPSPSGTSSKAAN